jgi:hypothetical protein
MKKILVCAEDSLSIIRIERLLFAKNLAFDIQKSPIKKDELFRYEIIIIHSSWRLANVFSFIENIVLSKTIPVLYVTSLINIAPFTKIKDHPYFSIIEEGKLDTELPIAITLMKKFASEMEKLQTENNKIKNKEELSKLMESCKKVLINQGMTEDTAHKYILKRAMDDQISKYDSCLRIIQENTKKDID